MGKLAEWWKQEGAYSAEKRYVTLVKSLLLALLPCLCGLMYCGAQGRSLGEVYLPASLWNDELLYYKQVEGILRFGYPLGYYGFNESHALRLSFAAWSPVLLLPWVLWGLVFGWNLMSPILCNIALMALCCFLFVWLVRPSWKQTGILTVLFCLFMPMHRYMLSGMPEITCIGMLITFYALAINFLRREKTYKLVLLFVLSGVMTLMRPYMVLFMILPAHLWIRGDRRHRFRWAGAAGSAAALGTALGLYVCIRHYLGAEYFAPLFDTSWIRAFLEHGIAEGLRYTLGKLCYAGVSAFGYIRQGIRTGQASGAFMAGFVLCMCILAVQSFLDWRRLRRLFAKQAGAAGMEAEATVGGAAGMEAEATVGGAAEAATAVTAGECAGETAPLRNRLIIEAHLAFSFIAMWFAMLLMYKLTEGSRHLLTFMAAAVFVIALMETRFFKKAVTVGAAFAYFYSCMAAEPLIYEVPFVQEERRAALEAFVQSPAGGLELNRENAPGYENVVIWAYSDIVDGDSVSTAWQLLYGLPEGFGISCCMPEYIISNFHSLQSRYLASPKGGEIDAMCREAGYRLLYSDADIVFYERAD